MIGLQNLYTPQRASLKVNNEPLIKLRDVGIIRGRRTILSEVSETVNKGDFIAVTGPNGGGKTTLMRLILQLIKPTTGSVQILDPKIHVGYLPQKSAVDSHYPITVREVVESGLLGPKEEGRETMTVEQALTEVELTEHASKPFGALSGGQQQRALLARAIIARPDMLVLDEPLSYIDKHFERKIYEIVRRLSETTTIILVSHEITTVASMANRHWIVDGKVSECASAHHFARIALCE